MLVLPPHMDPLVLACLSDESLNRDLTNSNWKWMVSMDRMPCQISGLNEPLTYTLEQALTNPQTT